MGELSIHRWKGFELYPVINKKTVTTAKEFHGLLIPTFTGVSIPYFETIFLHFYLPFNTSGHALHTINRIWSR